MSTEIEIANTKSHDSFHAIRLQVSMQLCFYIFADTPSCMSTQLGTQFNVGENRAWHYQPGSVRNW